MVKSNTELETLITNAQFSFPNRVDCSVNSAYVQDPYSLAPVLHTRTGGNPVNGFNGGGLGNKCILGFRTVDTLGIGSWSGHQYTYKDLSPLTSLWQPYSNYVVDMNGNGTLYKIFSMDPLVNPLLNLTSSVTNLDGSKTVTHTGGTHYVQVVSDLAGVAPFVDLGGGNWTNRAWRISDILAVYPSARFKEAASGDGGMPKSMVTPAFMLVVGDSSNNLIHAARLTNIIGNSVGV